MINDQKTCSRCILDSTIPGIRFDDEGVCNYCKIHDKLEQQFPLNELGQQKLNQLIHDIKAKGKNKKYDCIVGISGGTDSTYCLYMAKKLGLRPLAVHIDSGWNSDIAIINMKNAVTKLNVDLKTVTCDWEEFKDLQISFLKASVPDVGTPSEIAIFSTLYRAAAEEGIHYIINGHSFRTEGLMPLRWSYTDGKYTKSVHKMFGETKLKSFPNFTIFDLLYYVFVKGIKVIPFLAYVDYRKEDVEKILEKELDCIYYGRHSDSIFTRYFISYLRWEKFKIDSRVIEYSAFIRSGQLTREEALEKLKEPPLEDKELVKYCIKKLGLTEEEFEEIMSTETKTFLDYSTYYSIIRAFRVPIKVACKFGILPEIFYDKYLGGDD